MAELLAIVILWFALRHWMGFIAATLITITALVLM